MELIVCGDGAHCRNRRKGRVEFGGSKMQPGMTPTICTETIAVPHPKAVAMRIPAAHQNGEQDMIDAVLSELRAELGDKRYTLWIEGKIGLSLCDDLLTVSVGSPFLLSWMQKQFKELISQAARRVVGPSARIAFDVRASMGAQAAGVLTRSDAALEAPPVVDTAQSIPMAPRTSAELHDAILAAGTPLAASAGVPGTVGRSAGGGLPLSGQARSRRLADLSDFIPGPQTELALTAAKQVAEGTVTMFNPLYIHGPVGTGKTHLLEGICRRLKRTHPTANVMLLTSEAFANYFTQALRDRSLPSFRQRFRGVDVLLVDDIDFFESKRVFQEEFLHTFTELVDHGRQVVLTGSRHPRLLTKLGDELATRFLSGLVCRLDMPDAATRQAIVSAKAARMPGEFAPETLQYIAHRFQNSVRELEGALNCLQTYHSMTGKRVTLTQARQVLSDLERDCLRIVRLADIERVICSVFGVKPKDLQSDSRVRTVSQPRMLAMFLARKHTQSAYTEIGQHFGGRNHSTVMSAERKVQQWLDENSSIQVASQTWTIGEILSTIEQQLLAG